jgi:hypothetical protein
MEHLVPLRVDGLLVAVADPLVKILVNLAMAVQAVAVEEL